jgi:hypothetical protein
VAVDLWGAKQKVVDLFRIRGTLISDMTNTLSPSSRR